jgi:hypothetical protein
VEGDLREPGRLVALDNVGRTAWDACVEAKFAAVESLLSRAPRLLRAAGPGIAGTTSIDWTGLPPRVSACVGRASALRLLDWEGDHGDEGRRRLQHEYIEWRVVRKADAVTQIEFTTELPEYWEVLAGHAPAAALALIAEFANEPEIDARDVYGLACDPFGEDTTAAQRAVAFRRTMIRGRSPLNSGTRAICCMVQGSNSLGALVRLAAAAAGCRPLDDCGVSRSMNCAEAIPLLEGAAEDGRSSDPLVVERIARLAFEGRRIAFDDPIGIYIAGVERSRLRTPEGEPVPAEWFTLSRGQSADASPDGRPRYQRLSLKVPEDVGYDVDALFDGATEEPIRYGGQVADLVQVAVVLRVDSAPGEREAAGPAAESALPLLGAPNCADVEGSLREFEEEQRG